MCIISIHRLDIPPFLHSNKWEWHTLKNTWSCFFSNLIQARNAKKEWQQARIVFIYVASNTEVDGSNHKSSCGSQLPPCPHLKSKMVVDIQNTATVLPNCWSLKLASAFFWRRASLTHVSSFSSWCIHVAECLTYIGSSSGGHYRNKLIRWYESTVHIVAYAQCCN